ncbi:MAG: Uncharacterized protein XD78_1211 [Desulfotomaculum sp. 46_296]|nr:MAG: Uncharacterized protein XD78_1211 [Desulfotomaculum sp. 46_296]HAU31320.1 DUF2905 domain-containing protein [Desulfotomaculum sp.]
MPGLGEQIGRLLLTAGFLLILLGGLLIALSKIKFINLGRLPGDIFIQKGNYSFYFPIITCLLLSILLTILVNCLFRK